MRTTQNVKAKAKAAAKPNPAPLLVILDNGHGRETPGKRSPAWYGMEQLMELAIRIAGANTGFGSTWNQSTDSYATIN